MRHGLCSICAGTALMTAVAWSAVAQDNQVRLESFEGDTRVTGELVGFEDGVYSLKTAIGVLNIPSESVTCEGAACPRFGAPQLTVAVGDGALAAALEDVLQKFAAGNGAEIVEGEARGADRRLDLRQAGDTVAEVTLRQVRDLSPDGLSDAAIDIALVAEPHQRSGRGRLLATDAVVALVHPDNPVRALGAEDLAGVLDGTISDWSALGGPEAEIVLVLPESGTLAAGAVAGVTGITPERGDAVAVSEIPARVAATPGALGLTLWSARGEGGRALGFAGPCGAVIPADGFTIGSRLYPLLADVTIRTGSGDLPDIAGELADFFASDAARQRLAGAGLPPRPPVAARPVGQQGDHLARSVAEARNEAELEQLQKLIADIVDARQLSAVYRFGSNAVRAEPEHARLTAAIADYLAGLDPERTEIFLHGYADELETSRRRVGLSRARAEYVRNLIGEAAPDFAPGIRAAGFEGLAPRACNREAAGRGLNRRVEVWIRSSG